MALRTWTITEALEDIFERSTPLQTNPALDAAERALVGELAQACTLVQNALRPDNTIAAGQRNARAQQVEDKVHALNIVEAAHESEISIDAFYNMLDLATDMADAIRRGAPTFLSNLGEGIV